MKTIIAMTALASVALADRDSTPSYNSIMEGTYEFEIMGRPHRLYVCDSMEKHSDNELDNKHALYWSVADRTSNEYTIALGRDFDGVEYDGDYGTYKASCAIFRLHGEKTLKGYYELVFEEQSLGFKLRERFPELESGQADTEIWNEYELIKLSPAIVGNPDMEGKQCFHPGNNVVYQIPLPSLWESDYQLLDDGFYYRLIQEDALTSCWKLDNEFGSTAQAGWHYGYDFEWDGALLISRFDSVLKNHGCKVGSQFMVMVSEDMALVTTQCEDKSTGRTYFMHLQDYTDKHMMCPFETSPIVKHVAEKADKDYGKK